MNRVHFRNTFLLSISLGSVPSLNPVARLARSSSRTKTTMSSAAKRMAPVGTLSNA
uniref:Uncharacterized protein n=1 Tax=Arundo donax TaxID=35708 RepID=A0A0A9CA46_ARUDO